MVDAIEAINGSSPIGYMPLFPHRAETPTDSVLLSQTAQAQLLEQQGMSAAEIADQLGIGMSAVLGDLGVVVTNSQPAVAKAAA